MEVSKIAKLSVDRRAVQAHDEAERRKCNLRKDMRISTTQVHSSSYTRLPDRSRFCWVMQVSPNLNVRRKNSQVTIQCESYQIRVRLMQSGAARREEHHHDLLQHSQRKDAVGICERDFPFGPV